MELRRGLLRIQPHIATDTGNPISLTAVTAAFMRLNVAFEPTLGGSGTPSPSNIRPISGWNGVTVTQTLGHRTQNDGATWSGTIYGGAVDLVTGEITESWLFHEYDGSSDEDWKMESISIGKNFYINVPDAPGTRYFGDMVCSAAQVRVNGASYAQGMCFISSGKNLNLAISAAIGASDVAGLRTWLSTHPVQIAFRINTANTYSIDPQTIHALAGNTTITSNAGNMDIEYWSY